MTSYAHITVDTDLLPDVLAALAARHLVAARVPSAPSQTPRFVIGHTTGSVPASADALSQKEFAVLVAMSHGHTNVRIGRELGVTEDTVKTYARRMFDKLGATDRTHAVALAYRRGVLPVPHASGASR